VQQIICSSCQSISCYVCRQEIKLEKPYEHFCQLPHCQHKVVENVFSLPTRRKMIDRLDAKWLKLKSSKQGLQEMTLNSRCLRRGVPERPNNTPRVFSKWQRTLDNNSIVFNKNNELNDNNDNSKLNNVLLSFINDNKPSDVLRSISNTSKTLVDKLSDVMLLNFSNIVNDNNNEPN
jgi:hypothetical protein